MKHKVKNIHFVGIGGSGMSGIAEVLVNLGFGVSGSDLADNATTRRLAGLGVRVMTGHATEHVGSADAVVISTAVRDHGRDYWTGTVYTTNRRVWEHDDQFKEYLRATRCMAIDMETATLFAVGFFNHIPAGALLLVSDHPMVPEGVTVALTVLNMACTLL